MIQAIFMSLEILLWILILYTMYKVVWYSIKMLSLKRKLKEMNSGSTVVYPKRNFIKTIFGNKGFPDFVITTPNTSCEVSIISFISTHSRWNIEKTHSDYYIEVRKKNNVFYKAERTTGTEPEYARDYRRETRFIRSKLFISPFNEKFDKQILLIYPRPQHLTYTENRHEHITSGSLVGGHEIMYEDAFFELIQAPKTV